MSESEEIKPEQEQKSSSATEAVTHSVDVPAPLPEGKPTKEGSPETESPKEVAAVSPHLQKVELKKHLPPVPHPVPAAPPASAPAPHPAPAPVLNYPTKEVAANAPQAGMEVEIDFVLDRKRISLTELSTLAVGEMITLSGADFRATLFLQEKAIGEAELVMVDQRPSLQITKIFSAS